MAITMEWIYINHVNRLSLSVPFVHVIINHAVWIIQPYVAFKSFIPSIGAYSKITQKNQKHAWWNFFVVHSCNIRATCIRRRQFSSWIFLRGIRLESLSRVLNILQQIALFSSGQATHRGNKYSSLRHFTIFILSKIRHITPPGKSWTQTFKTKRYTR